MISEDQQAEGRRDFLAPTVDRKNEVRDRKMPRQPLFKE
jgi:hypothetical protein